MKNEFITKVDGVGLPSRYWAGMTVEKAVEKMRADGISNDPAWVRATHAKLMDAVKLQDEKMKNAANPDAKKPEPFEHKTFLAGNTPAKNDDDMVISTGKNTPPAKPGDPVVKP